MFGLSSKKSSLFDLPRSSVLSRNAKPSAKVSPPVVISVPNVTVNVPDVSEPPEERLAVCKRLNFEDHKDEDSREYEDLMTRLKKKMHPGIDLADKKLVGGMDDPHDPVKAAVADLSQEEVGDDPIAVSDGPNPADESMVTPSIADENNTSKAKIRDLVKRFVDPKVVPKLGRKPPGEDELIIEEEPTGVEKLFMRLEKELESKKKKQTTSVELRSVVVDEAATSIDDDLL